MTSPAVAVPAPSPLPVIPLREIAPWLVFVAALLGVVYFLFLDQGALSVVPGSLLHEFAHDGRHLFGFPCH